MKLHHIAAIAGGVAFATVSAQADATNRWESTAAAGLTITKGNSDTVLGSVSLGTERKWPRDEVRFNAGLTYGENDGKSTTDTIGASGQYNHLFTERLYGGFKVDYLHDTIAKLSYRFTLSPMVGYYVIKNPTTILAFEVGPAGVIEKQGGVENQYAALRVAERFEHKFSATAKVWESIEVIPQVDRFSNYLVIGEVGAEAALSTQFSLRAVLQDIYDNEPAPHRKNNDLKLISSLVYKF